MSVEPAWWLMQRGMISERAAQLYEPLGWACDRVPGMGNAVEWYLSVWVPEYDSG